MTNEHIPEDIQTPDGRGNLLECPSFETLSVYFDNELDPGLKARIDAHLAECDLCVETIGVFRTVRQSLNVTTPRASSRSFLLTEAMIATPAQSPDIAAPSAPTPISRRFSLPPTLLPVLTAVAAILLIAIIAGDLFVRDRNDGVDPTPVTSNAMVIEGTQVPITAEDQEDTFGAAAAGDNMNDGATSADNDTGSAPAAAPSSTESAHATSSWWRAAEISAGLLFAALLILTLARRHMRRA